MVTTNFTQKVLDNQLCVTYNQTIRSELVTQQWLPILKIIVNCVVRLLYNKLRNDVNILRHQFRNKYEGGKKMHLYRNVKRACYQRDTNIDQVEQALGFARGSIYKWDKSKPGIEKVKKVADYLNVTVDSLISDDPEDKE